MTEEAVNSKWLGDHVLARTIANMIVMFTGYWVSTALGINLVGNLWSFLAFVLVGSFIGNTIGASVGRRLAGK